MAVRGGDLIHVGNQVLLDRAQTAGPGQVNIPTEKIYELGNHQAVGTVLDIPDLTFPVESLDVSAEFESLLVGTNFATDADGTEYDISKVLPIDVASQFTYGASDPNSNDVSVGVAVPALYLDQLSYRLGLSQNAQQTAQLRGDGIYYTPGSVYTEVTAGTAAASQVVTLAHNAYPFYGDVIGGVKYVLGVMLASGRRLFKDVDYVETVTGSGDAKAVTITLADAVPTTDKIRVIYSSDTVATYPQTSHAAASATRPAAIRGRNIRVFVGGSDITDVWTGVQNFNLDWRVTRTRDLEFGNDNVVDQDFDVPTVSGSIDFLPRDAKQLYTRVAQAAGATHANEVVGALQQAVLPMDIVLYSPISGAPLKTLHIEDARLTVPGYSGRVQQQLSVTFNFDSDTGSLKVYKGERP